MGKEINIKVNARHIGQLGRELVTDYVTALTELVKNSYDADSEAVEVIFENMLSKQGRVIIADTGCGFTSDDIENKWAVIGTNSKVKNPYSEKYKRRCVGRKGIGRYSVERLAEYCTLYSFTKTEAPVKYYTNWNKYEGIDFKELKQRIQILKNNPDFESAKYIKRAVEYLLLSDRIDEESKKTIKEKLLAGCNLDYTIFYRKNMLSRMEQILYPIYEKYMGLEERVEEIKNVIEELHGVEKDFFYQKLERLYQRVYSGRMDNEPYTGTFLVLDCLRDDWTKKDIEKVIKEFRLLVSLFKEKNEFSIYITASEYENELQLYRNLAALGILAGSFGHETDDAIARILLNIEYPKQRLFRVFPNDDDVEAAFDDLDNDIWRISCYSDLLVAFLKKKKRSEAINLSFKKIIEEVVGYYQVLVEEYQVDIDIGDLEEFQCKMAMKQIDLESIIINFLTNAFEALKGVTGARIIKISAASLEEGYCVALEDSGKGVPENLREWIFIPLNTTKKEDGVGLGLTIVKDIVESYAGKIVIGDSAVLGGARFETFFPAAG